MNQEQLEVVYEAVAAQLEQLDEANWNVFFGKLVLLLAQDQSDVDRILDRIRSAAANLDV